MRACVRACAPEDGRNYRPKHVELIEIISKIITVVSSWLFILLLKSYFHTVGTVRIVAVCECAHACVRVPALCDTELAPSQGHVFFLLLFNRVMMTCVFIE